MAIRNSIWWGPPKKFSAKTGERKISWLELFYDLVYVIVISKTTHLLVLHVSMMSIVDYLYLFSIIFWGWINGSQYHDLHGSPGIRTRFMTLWQMIAVAALAATLDSPPDKLLFRATIAIAFLQGYITYLWWSVGIYDKEHRKLNVPYSICYLLSLGLIIASLFIPQPYKRMVFWLSLVLNYLPPFIVFSRIRERKNEFSLSASMVERLGLMVIIVFGEAILGVINGMSIFTETAATYWLCFGMGILIIFALWWIFFALIADRESKGRYMAGMMMSLFYIPVISSLGMAGAFFPGVMESLKAQPAAIFHLSRIMYGAGLSVFLCSISAISMFLSYPDEYTPAKRLLQPLVLVAGVLVFLITVLFQSLSLMPYLCIIFAVLLTIIVIITNRWYRVEVGKEKE